MAPESPESPWRSVFEQMRTVIGKTRDENGILGSINWLRQAMARRGANPNVVRNIIYRDKGKLEDKRALYEIIKSLWQDHAGTPLQAPELDALLSPENGAEQEVTQLLGREKRRAYSAFVGGVRAGQTPHLVVTGRPGSGKTLLSDYIQQALELPPKASGQLLRFEFSSDDLAASLTQFAQRLGVRRDLIEAKLVKVVAQSAYAVQADAQADIARTVTDLLKGRSEPLVLLLHLSQSLAEQDHLGASALRLNTPDVPRVNAAEWLWFNLLEPLSRLPNLSLFVSMVNLPARALQELGAFEGPVKLNPPTAAEARRFIRARLPRLSPQQQEAIVQRAGRSFEELRTLTLLTEIREPLPEDGDEREDLEGLSRLLSTAGDGRLRDFLRALAVSSVPEFPSFSKGVLLHLRDPAWQHLSGLELAFLDAAPGQDDSYRCFSRRLARQLKSHFEARHKEAYRALNARAAQFYVEANVPGDEETARYLYHLLEARDWDKLETWLRTKSMPQALVRRLWDHAEHELLGERFEKVALQVAAHYVRLGSYTHPDLARAFARLERSDRAEVQLWACLKRAEGAVLRGHVDEAERLLGGAVDSERPDLRAERALIEASIARWRSDLSEAARRVNDGARPLLAQIATEDGTSRLIHVKVAVWAGLIAKDEGRLEAALEDFASVRPGDDLIDARAAFQQGDILLRLGRFDAALQQLDKAVERAQRSDALLQEQTRYLARRAKLHVLRGELESAARDFTAALALQADEEDSLETAFWRAKVEDERALYLLAKGDFGEAILTLRHNQDVFTAYERGHGVDASYRKLRNQLRLASAYGHRAYANPLGRPLVGLSLPVNPLDLEHARRLLSQCHEALERLVGTTYGALQRHYLLSTSLFAEHPAEALANAERARTLAGFSYQAALAHARAALAQLRLNDAEAALDSARDGLEALKRSQGADAETGDAGLHCWLVALELRALLLRDDVAGALTLLDTFVSTDRAPAHKEALLRAFGESAESDLPDARRHPALAALIGDALNDECVRLPDLLIAYWQRAGSFAGAVLV